MLSLLFGLLNAATDINGLRIKGESAEECWKHVNEQNEKPQQAHGSLRALDEELVAIIKKFAEARGLDHKKLMEKLLHGHSEQERQYLFLYCDFLLELQNNTSPLTDEMQRLAHMLFGRDVFNKENSVDYIVGVLDPVRLVHHYKIPRGILYETCWKSAIDYIHLQMRHLVFPKVTEQKLTAEMIVRGLLNGICYVSCVPIKAHSFSSEPMPAAAAAAHDQFHYQNFINGMRQVFFNWVAKEIEEMSSAPDFNLRAATEKVTEMAIERWKGLMLNLGSKLDKEKKK